MTISKLMFMMRVAVLVSSATVIMESTAESLMSVMIWLTAGGRTIWAICGNSMRHSLRQGRMPRQCAASR